MAVGSLLLKATVLNKIISRNAFTATKPNSSNPNMFRVGLAFGSTALLWALLFKQNRTDMLEYKTRNGLE